MKGASCSLSTPQTPDDKVRYQDVIDQAFSDGPKGVRSDKLLNKSVSQNDYYTLKSYLISIGVQKYQ